MKKLLLHSAVVFCCNQTFAQSSKWGVTFTPAIVHTTSYNAGLQLGGEYRFSNRLGLLTEFTVAIKREPDASYPEQRFFRVKPELRYFLSGNKTQKGPYAGLQISYSSRSWKAINGSYFEDQIYEDSAITFQRAFVRSPVISSSLQLGALATLGDHFCLDFFLGIGARLIHTSYSDVQNSGKVYSLPPKCKIIISPDPAWWVNGNITRVHFNTGIRFLYRF